MVLISFLSIAVATISVTSLNYYIEKSDELLINKSIYQQNELENVIDRLETLFGTSSSLMHQFWLNSLKYVIPYFLEGENTSQNLNAILTNLKTTQINFAQYGFSLSILNSATNTLYSPSGIVSLESVLGNLGLDVSAASKVLALKPGDAPKAIITDGGVLLFCKPWSNASERNRLVECFQFDLNTLKIDIRQLENCGFWLSFDGKELISLQGAGGPTLLEEAKNSEIYKVLAQESRFFDFTYSTATPLNPGIFFQPGTPKRIFFILLISLSIMLLIYFFSKLLYHPIQVLYRDALNISKNSKTPKRNELQVVASTLNYLHNTVETLQETANQNKNLLREKKVKDLLLGLSNYEDIPQIVKELSLPFVDSQGSIILVELRDTDTMGVYELARLSENVWGYLKDDLSLFTIQENEAVLQTLSLRRFCIMSAQNNLEQLRASAQTIKSKIQDGFNQDVTIAIREIRTNETIPEVYDRALILLKSKANQRFNLLTEGQNKLAIPTPGLLYSMDTEKELIKTIQGGDTGALQALVSHIISQNIKENVPISQLIQVFHITILRVMKDTGVSSEIANYVDSLKTKNVAEFQEIIIKELIQLAQEIMKKEKIEVADFSHEVTNYIEENYDKDISLTDVANHFQFSTVYMSTLFKSTIGINFKEYLTKVRVGNAKMLLDKGEKIYNVSNQVGCNNVDTFIRMFKRVTGISPGKYQQRYRNPNIENPEA